MKGRGSLSNTKTQREEKRIPNTATTSPWFPSSSKKFTGLKPSRKGKVWIRTDKAFPYLPMEPLHLLHRALWFGTPLPTPISISRRQTINTR